MIDFEKLLSALDYTTFDYWFVRTISHLTVYQKTETLPVHFDPTDINVVEENGELIIPDEVISLIGQESAARILSDWEKFKKRPEYIVGKPIEYSDMEDAQNIYENLITGCILIKAWALDKDPDVVIPKAKRCVEWLRTTDFYRCPASTQYHDSVPGGLLQHTLKVADCAVNLLAAKPFKNRVSIASAVFVSLVHDWCKIGLYVSYAKNVKDDATGQWVKVPGYKYAEDRAIALGHGVSSMYLVMKFIHLPIDEAAAIRWHMGRWNCVDAEFNELQQSNRQFPIVHLVQFADQLAITQYI